LYKRWQQITSESDGGQHTQLFELTKEGESVLEIEYIEREDWEGMIEPCPECEGTEFDHVRYEGGHYGQYEDTVIERTDYWYQHGSLYTACKDCDEVLHKHPAYDVLEAVETGSLDYFISTE